MYGESNIDYGNITLQAEEIEIDWNQKTIEANFKVDSLGKKVGKPIFSEDNQSYETDKITYNFDSKKAKIKGIVTQLDDAYMQGEDVKKNEFDELFIHDAKYTLHAVLRSRTFIYQPERLKQSQEKVVSVLFI